MKSDGEIMEILDAYDLTGSLRATAELTGCSHHTVAKHVQARDAGRPIGEPAARGRVTDPFLPKIEEWVETRRPPTLWSRTIMRGHCAQPIRSSVATNRRGGRPSIACLSGIPRL